MRVCVCVPISAMLHVIASSCFITVHTQTTTISSFSAVLRSVVVHNVVVVGLCILVCASSNLLASLQAGLYRCFCACSLVPSLITEPVLSSSHWTCHHIACLLFFHHMCNTAFSGGFYPSLHDRTWLFYFSLFRQCALSVMRVWSHYLPFTFLLLLCGPPICVCDFGLRMNVSSTSLFLRFRIPSFSVFLRSCIFI